MSFPEDIQKQIDEELKQIKSGEVAEEVEQEVEEVVETEEVEEVEAEAEEVKEVEEKSPPGFVSYEDWVAQGKDPDDWRGANAYKREYDRIQENKDLLDKMSSLVSLIEDEKQTAAERARAEERLRFEQELNEAKENMDVDKVEELLKNQPKDPVKEEFVEPAPIANYRKSNPILDPTSPQFDEQFEGAVARVVNSKLQQFGAGVDDDIVSRVMDVAYNEVKALYPEKFESPKNSRKTVTKPTPAKKTKRFQNIEAEAMGGQVKASSVGMLKFFEDKYGKDHPTTVKFRKSMEA